MGESGRGLSAESNFWLIALLLVGLGVGITVAVLPFGRNTMSAAENLQKGQEFLAENKTKEGVEETASGLQYKVLEPGSGKTPARTDTVTVHYEGRLIEGTVFDSSYQRGAPIDFGLNQVIPGWTEGVALMQEGAKYELYIPADLAYGERGAGAVIGPNETLIFTVELLKVH